jgi:hypothetical protein
MGKRLVYAGLEYLSLSLSIYIYIYNTWKLAGITLPFYKEKESHRPK